MVYTQTEFIFFSVLEIFVTLFILRIQFFEYLQSIIYLSFIKFQADPIKFVINEIILVNMSLLSLLTGKLQPAAVG